MNYLEQVELCESPEELYNLALQFAKIAEMKTYLLTTHYDNRSEMFIIKANMDANALAELMDTVNYDFDNPPNSTDIEELELKRPYFVMELTKRNE